MNKRTTISIKEDKKLMLERAGIEIAYKTGKMVSWSEVVHYMIENYSKMAVQDMIEKMK